jgi:ATP-dependent DNA helicase RecG
MNDLLKLISGGENEGLEFKESPRLKDEICQVVSAFSNANSGSILIGISNDGKVIGVDIGRNTIEELANYIKRNTDPAIFPSVKILDAEGKKIIMIEVKESAEKPVFFKNHAYKRVGKTNQQISSSEMRKLVKESSAKVYWDEQVCKEASLEYIDWEFVKNFFIPGYEKFSKKRIIGTPEELLEALNCIKESKPTNAGILLFGRNPQKIFMNSYLALARYKAKMEGVERLDYKEFFGNLFHQIDECHKYIKEHIAIMSRLLPHKVEREDIPEYCWFSIRELITNAVCHRDYEDQGSKVIVKTFSDRIEFYNPGGLPKGITPENILIRQYSRNPVIANALAKVKYIEELGEGWNKIIDEHKNHPLKPKPPKIISDKYSILVILYSVGKKFEKTPTELNERQKGAIGYLRRNDRITNTEYQEINRTTKKTATRDLQELVGLGILIKSGRTGRGVYYSLNPTYKGDKRGQKGTKI